MANLLVLPYRSISATPNDTTNTIYVRHWDAHVVNLYEYDYTLEPDKTIYLSLFYENGGYAVCMLSSTPFTAQRFYKNNDVSYYDSQGDGYRGVYKFSSAYYKPGVSGIVTIYEWNTSQIPVYTDETTDDRWNHFISDAGIGNRPITYRLTNCTAPSAPTEAGIGDMVTVPFQFTSGYGIVNPSSDLYVTNNGVVIPSQYSNGVLTFTMPDPS